MVLECVIDVPYTAKFVRQVLRSAQNVIRISSFLEVSARSTKLDMDIGSKIPMRLRLVWSQTAQNARAQ